MVVHFTPFPRPVTMTNLLPEYKWIHIKYWAKKKNHDQCLFHSKPLKTDLRSDHNISAAISQSWMVNSRKPGSKHWQFLAWAVCFLILVILFLCWLKLFAIYTHIPYALIKFENTILIKDLCHKASLQTRVNLKNLMMTSCVTLISATDAVITQKLLLNEWRAIKSN